MTQSLGQPYEFYFADPAAHRGVLSLLATRPLPLSCSEHRSVSSAAFRGVLRCRQPAATRPYGAFGDIGTAFWRNGKRESCPEEWCRYLQMRRRSSTSWPRPTMTTTAGPAPTSPGSLRRRAETRAPGGRVSSGRCAGPSPKIVQVWPKL